MSIRATVALTKNTVLPGDVRRSKPPRMFAIVINDTTTRSTTTHYHPGDLAAACDYARGLIRGRHTANIRRAVLNPSEP